MRMLAASMLSLLVFVAESSLAADPFAGRSVRGECSVSQARSEIAMTDDVAAELKRLQRNQTTLMAAINRLIAETAPINHEGPRSARYVTTGLVVNADGFIVPGTIPAPDPTTTLRGVRAGDPLWTQPLGSP